MTIVRTTYRYKRPPKKRKPKGPVIEGPRIVHAKTPKPGSVPRQKRSDDTTISATTPANDDRKTAIKVASSYLGQGPPRTAYTKSAIVTARRPRKPANALPPGLLPETSEEHRQRGDAADALWREMVRRVAGKERRE